jgi:hypothetical protein
LYCPGISYSIVEGCCPTESNAIFEMTTLYHFLTLAS